VIGPVFLREGREHKQQVKAKKPGMGYLLKKEVKFFVLHTREIKTDPRGL
jgi:hypothetical protein